MITINITSNFFLVGGPNGIFLLALGKPLETLGNRIDAVLP